MADKEESAYAEMVEELIQESGNLTEWEEEFVDSLFNRIGRGKPLTMPQIEKLEKIYDRYCG